jgi:hypothetical protein
MLPLLKMLLFSPLLLSLLLPLLGLLLQLAPLLPVMSLLLLPARSARHYKVYLTMVYFVIGPSGHLVNHVQEVVVIPAVEV